MSLMVYIYIGVPRILIPCISSTTKSLLLRSARGLVDIRSCPAGPRLHHFTRCSRETVPEFFNLVRVPEMGGLAILSGESRLSGWNGQQSCSTCRLAPKVTFSFRRGFKNSTEEPENLSRAGSPRHEGHKNHVSHSSGKRSTKRCLCQFHPHKTKHKEERSGMPRKKKGGGPDSIS